VSKPLPTAVVAAYNPYTQGPWWTPEGEPSPAAKRAKRLEALLDKYDRTNAEQAQEIEELRAQLAHLRLMA